jgi:hypothetical protein
VEMQLASYSTRRKKSQLINKNGVNRHTADVHSVRTKEVANDSADNQDCLDSFAFIGQTLCDVVMNCALFESSVKQSPPCDSVNAMSLSSLHINYNTGIKYADFVNPLFQDDRRFD